jgi:hypothetical protein
VLDGYVYSYFTFDDHLIGHHGTYAFAQLWGNRKAEVLVEASLSGIGFNRWMVGFVV